MAAAKDKDPGDRGTLPHYAVERGLLNAAARDMGRDCPICGKKGAWQGDVFVPTDEKGGGGYPPCKCGTIHAGGGFMFDTVAKKVVKREVGR